MITGKEVVNIVIALQNRMLHKKCNKDLAPFTPPDIQNPPLCIPLKSLDDRYQVVEELGNGSFGSVSLARAQFDVTLVQSEGGKQRQMVKDTLMNQNGTENDNSNGKEQGIVAIKTMMTRLPTLHDYTRVREVKFILSIPANKHLIQIFEMFVDSRAYQLHIVMECMEQNLYQMMRHRRRRVFSIPSLKSILAQILAGIRHIHDQNFFHRDVKPENILISPSTRYFDKNWLSQGNYTDNYIVKLADFGLARHTDNKNPYTAYVSTRWYRSPEILLRSGYYSRPLDIWAFGCVALEVTIFKPLFPGSNEMDQIWKILEVLGTPHRTRESEKTGYKSHGGSWEDAKVLAQRLNMKFPYVEGTGLDNFISSVQLQPLTDVIKACLKWDPNQRATAEQLCMMPFFQGTIAPEECIAAISSKEAITAATASTSAAKCETKPRTTNTEQALIFAGIKSHARAGPSPANENGYHTRQLVFHSEGLTEAQQRQFKENNNKSFHEEIGGSKDLEEVEIVEEEVEELEGEEEGSPFDNALGDFLTDDVESHTPGELVDTDSTISEDDDNQDEIDISHEIAQNIAFCEIPPRPTFENGQFVSANDNSRRSDQLPNDANNSVKQLADEIEAFNKQDPDFYSQYYSSTNTIPTTMTSNIASNKNNNHTPFTETLNYVHYNSNNNHQATSPATSTGGDSTTSPQDANNNKHQTHSSLQPVNKLLDNMSIDDSFSNSSNNVNLIPRSFMLPPQNDFEDPIFQLHQPQQQSNQQHNFNQHFGNVTF